MKKGRYFCALEKIADKPMVRMRRDPISQSSALLSPPERSDVDTGKRTATRSTPAFAQSVGRLPVDRRAADRVCLLAGESTKRAGNRYRFSQKNFVYRLKAAIFAPLLFIWMSLAAPTGVPARLPFLIELFLPV
jgi:hypothetical protein